MNIYYNDYSKSSLKLYLSVYILILILYKKYLINKKQFKDIFLLHIKIMKLKL
jgi:hypothetical protein